MTLPGLDRRGFLAGSIGTAGLAAGLSGGCTQLDAFDTVMPEDPGIRRLVRGQSFAPHARGSLDIYAPTGPAPQGGWPVMVFWYGGSWRSGRKEDYAFAASAFASLGMICVLPDYRLVPEVVHPAFVEDGLAALAWTVTGIGALGGDPRRIILSGHSAGAWIAAMVAMDPSTRGQVAGWIGLAGPYDFLPLDVSATINAFGHLQGAALEATQPVRLPAAGTPPALLVHGDEDTTVRLRQSERMAAHLRSAGVPVELETLPNVGHITILTALARPLRGRAPTRAACRTWLAGRGLLAG